MRLLLLLFSTFLLRATAQAASGPNERCLVLDSCFFKTEAKTCSCQSDCHLYGTCCLGAEGGPSNSSGVADFRCYTRGTREPLFVRRSCSPGYRGHPHDGATCVDDDVDEADVVNNLLVINRLTQVTYWNKQCAKCNDENVGDLDFWYILVQCEAREGVDKDFIRRHLAFDPVTLRWGVRSGEDLVRCHVLYTPPASLREVKYCNPDVVRTCPADYPDQERAQKCSQSYAERKLKSANVYFQNIHCAICNGVDEKELECPGMSAGPGDTIDESDFREMTEAVFSGGEWIHRESGRPFECSPGHAYDPYRGKCRTVQTVTAASNSAPVFGKESFLWLATFLVVLL